MDRHWLGLRQAWAPGQRGSAWAILLTLALTLAVVTAVGRLAWLLLSGSTPYAHAHEVVSLSERHAQRGLEAYAVSEPNFRSWQTLPQFSGLAALREDSVNLEATAGQPAERVRSFVATANLWTVLGVPLPLGRSFSHEEELNPQSEAVLIGAGLWARRYGADPAVLGRELRINGRSLRIVGVVPQAMGFADDVDLWLPLTPSELSERRGDRRLDVLGRLAPGVGLVEARAALQSLSGQLAQAHPDSNSGWNADVVPVQRWLVGAQGQQRAWLLLGAVAVLLAVALSNLAGLQLARALRRVPDVAVRLALGALPVRLRLQAMQEGLSLALPGVVLGVLGGQFLSAALVPVLPAVALRQWQPHSGVGLAVLIASVAVLLVLLGQLLALRLQLRTARHAGVGEHAQAGRTLPGLNRRPWLVALQFALATALLGAAAHLAISFAGLRRTDLGFDPATRVLARLNLEAVTDEASHRRVIQQMAEVAAAARGLPGVQAVGWTSEVPMGDLHTGMGVAAPHNDTVHQAAWRIVDGGYFEALGVALLAGRGFAGEASGDEAVLSRSLAARLFAAGVDPIGRGIRLENGQWRTVIGIVEDVRQLGPGQTATPTMYFSTAWYVWPTMTLLLQTDRAGAVAAPAIARAWTQLRPHDPLYGWQALSALYARHLQEPAVQAAAFAVFALAAGALGVLGLLGVLQVVIQGGAAELALRLALGARLGRLRWHTVLRGLRWCAAGALLGCGVLWMVLPQLPMTMPRDLPMVAPALAAAALLTLAAVAGWWQACRISRLAPSAVLRGGA